VTADELVAYHRGDRVERVCAWDNGTIAVRRTGELEPVENTPPAAIRAHQGTIAHQAARRGRGIVDVTPGPAVQIRPLAAVGR
jgi:hypothetical protein